MRFQALWVNWIRLMYSPHHASASTADVMYRHCPMMDTCRTTYILPCPTPDGTLPAYFLRVTISFWILDFPAPKAWAQGVDERTGYARSARSPLRKLRRAVIAGDVDRDSLLNRPPRVLNEVRDVVVG
jgi:hypothetical protein